MTCRLCFQAFPLLLTVLKTGGRRSGREHLSDVYLGRQRVDPTGKIRFTHTFLALNNKQLVFCFLNILNV